jgi:hypothetical protein
MTRVLWGQSGQKKFETGIDRGVLYLPNGSGVYNNGYAWNGLTAVTESPSGAESNKQYADNAVYLNLVSVEEFGGTIEAFTCPRQFYACDGSAEIEDGVFLGQQDRKTFGLSYRTIQGNDVQGISHGYKLHIVYGALASPSEKNYATMNDSPEATPLSWEFSTTPVTVGTIGGVERRPSSTLVIDSVAVDPAALTDLEDLLYGTVGTDPSLPMPAAVYAIFSGTVTTVTPGVPTYNSSTDIITIPSTTGVIYSTSTATDPDPVDAASGDFGPITENTFVEARPADGYRFPIVVDKDWLITFA